MIFEFFDYLFNFLPVNKGKRVEDVRIAVSGEGNSYVVWCGYKGRDINLYGVRIDAEGNPGKAVNLSSYRGSHNLYDENPEIAGDAEGNFYITWNTSQPYEDMMIP